MKIFIDIKRITKYGYTIISINATNEIGNATNIATIAIIMTFIPMFFLGGMMGQFMHPLPVFVPISLVMSLFVAYAFTPIFS